MAEPRDSPYLWVTWITGLMAGQKHCQWAAWFRAHFKDHDRIPSTFDSATWKAQHGEMVRRRAEALKNGGYKVFIEEQNKFTWPGRMCKLGGKPDLVATKADDALVVDCKTGQRNDGDVFQMLIYMLALPYTHQARIGRPALRGEIEYQDGVLPVPADRLTAEFKTLLKVTIERAAGDAPSPRVPSFLECRYCDITKRDCPERIEEESPSPEVEHDLF